MLPTLNLETRVELLWPSRRNSQWLRTHGSLLLMHLPPYLSLTAITQIQDICSAMFSSLNLKLPVTTSSGKPFGLTLEAFTSIRFTAPIGRRSKLQSWTTMQSGWVLILMKASTRRLRPLATHPRYMSLSNIHGGALDRNTIIHVSYSWHPSSGWSLVLAACSEFCTSTDVLNLPVTCIYPVFPLWIYNKGNAEHLQCLLKFPIHVWTKRWNSIKRHKDSPWFQH